MDNVVAYREGQGEAPVTVPDAIAVMASDALLMPALMTQPVSNLTTISGDRRCQLMRRLPDLR